MAKIPQALHEYINTAFPENVCLIGSVQEDGFANIAPRGSAQVFDDETLAIWDRGGRASSEALEDGTKLMIYYRNPALGARGGNGLLAAGGIARFYGTAEIHREGPAYEQVWNNMVVQERNNDADKGGFAVLIRIERAENLMGKPLPEDLAPKEG
jgi:predicted pyridoxine 5'-phosphate oxidase superfamily flavin-nucleotide-binding protein